MICAARFSARPITSAACALASRMLSPASWRPAPARACRDRPRQAGGDLLLARFERIHIGVHTNFMQNHTKKMNVMDWPIKVALKFISHLLMTGVKTGVGDWFRSNPEYRQRQTERTWPGRRRSSARRRPDHHDEELGTQHRDQFGWRAAPSRKRPPRMPIPTAAPSAPQTHHQGTSDKQHGLESFPFVAPKNKNQS